MYAMKFHWNRRPHLLMFMLLVPHFFQDSNAKDIRVFSTLKIISRFDFKGYDLPGIREGDGKSFLKWVKHPGTTDFPEFSICLR